MHYIKNLIRSFKSKIMIKRLNKKKISKLQKIHKYFFIILFINIIIFSFLKINKKSINYNFINVAYALDNNYFYIAHVSMKSIMLNQNFDTFINFHILTSNITDKQKEIINKISLEHHNCKITYHIIHNQFTEFKSEGFAKWTTTIFYRLLLQNILKKEKKILYLDCDTLIYKDLKKIYNYNIKDKYYVGMLERKFVNLFGCEIKCYINSGVILINLANLRKDNIFNKIKEYLTKYNNKLIFPDQDTINAVCNKKNGVFPIKYVTKPFCKINEKTSYEDPYILHYIIYSKPWKGVTNDNNLVCYDPITRFYEFARKTSYYYEILNQFQVNLKI